MESRSSVCCSLLSQEQAWQRLIASQEAILERDAEARAQAPKPGLPAIESVGLDATLEETRRKMAFQVRPVEFDSANTDSHKTDFLTNIESVYFLIRGLCQ